MADLNQPATGTPAGSTRAQPAVDLGLRAFMLQVYNYMGLSLAITALVAYGVFAIATTTDPAAAAMVGGKAAKAAGRFYFTPLGRAFFGGPGFLIAAFSPLLAIILLYVGMWLSRSMTLALVLFFSVSALFGIGLSVTLIAYTEASLAKVFVITAATFGAMSLWGYTTTRDLSGLGSFLMMGLFGLVIAGLVNLFFRSPALDYALSVIGVVVFVGLTAYDTQKIKESYSESDGPFERTRKAITGALELYLDFVNLFLDLLKLFGQLRG